MECVGSLLETHFVFMLVNDTISMASVYISIYTLLVDRESFKLCLTESRFSVNSKPISIMVLAT